MLVGFRTLTIATEHLQRRRCSCYRLLRAAVIATAVIATIVGWRISTGGGGGGGGLLLTTGGGGGGGGGLLTTD